MDNVSLSQLYMSGTYMIPLPRDIEVSYKYPPGYLYDGYPRIERRERAALP